MTQGAKAQPGTIPLDSSGQTEAFSTGDNRSEPLAVWLGLAVNTNNCLVPLLARFNAVDADLMVGLKSQVRLTGLW